MGESKEGKKKEREKILRKKNRERLNLAGVQVWCVDCMMFHPQALCW